MGSFTSQPIALLNLCQIGQRTDVLVKATLPPDSAVFMRANITTGCSTANQPNAVAAIFYEKADRTKTPKSAATIFDASKCGNVIYMRP